MSYDGNIARNYVNNVVSDLKDVGNVLKLLYTSSLHRAERERISLGAVLKDIYNNGFRLFVGS